MNNETSSKDTRFPYILNNSHISTFAARWFYIQIFKPHANREKIFYRDFRLKLEIRPISSSRLALFSWATLKKYFVVQRRKTGTICLDLLPRHSESRYSTNLVPLFLLLFLEIGHPFFVSPFVSYLRNLVHF